MMSAKVSEKDIGFIESVSNFKDNLLNLKSLELAEEDSFSSSKSHTQHDFAVESDENSQSNITVRQNSLAENPRTITSEN